MAKKIIFECDDEVYHDLLDYHGIDIIKLLEGHHKTMKLSWVNTKYDPAASFTLEPTFVQQADPDVWVLGFKVHREDVID